MELIFALIEENILRVVVLLWCWWSARNKANQGERRISSDEICCAIAYHVNEMQKLKPSVTCTTNEQKKWQRPPEGVYKINCDRAFFQNNRRGSWGCIIRNHMGQFLAAAADSLQNLSCALHAEAIACLKGMELATYLGMNKVIVETDEQNLATALKSNDFDRAELGVIFREIKTRMAFDFISCNISKCHRSCNLVADCIASYGVSVGVDDSSLWLDHAPEFVKTLMLGDLPFGE
jgi:ribonuclease HI